jgi:ATP-dependent helicase/nuclease subunit B
MPQTVKNDENIKDAVVILSGFSSITRQRFDVFEAINQTASEVLAVVPYHETGNLYTGETYSKLLEIDPSATVIPSETDSFEAETLRKYLFSPDVLKKGFKPFETDKISLYTAYDTAEEVEFIAKDIICEVRNNQKRFKDISLAVGSISETLPHVKRIFSDYNIPFYVERQTLLSEHPLASLIISVLDLARRGVQVSDFVKVIGNATLIPTPGAARLGFLSSPNV